MTVLGPVFWYDLVRIARRQRVTLWRVVYATLLLAAIMLLYVEELPQADLFSGGVIKQREQMANFANAFFAAFVAVQFAAVIFFTPASRRTRLPKSAVRTHSYSCSRRT